jgi:hypothetical protein
LKTLAKLLLGITLLLVPAVVGVCVWMAYPYPQDQAPIEQALQSDEAVRVSQGDFLVFEPTDPPAAQGLIFYPGGKVDPVAYAPVLRELARAGLLVVVTPMPLKTAFLGVDRADEAMAAFPQIQTWYLGGHSLGGVAASLYAEHSADKLQGLLFWASYPVADLSALELPVLSIYARGDVQTTREEIADNRELLPADTRYIEIEGNHWQFGHFSSDLHQAPPAVSRSEQQAAIVTATLDFTGKRYSPHARPAGQ